MAEFVRLLTLQRALRSRHAPLPFMQSLGEQVHAFVSARQHCSIHQASCALPPWACREVTEGWDVLSALEQVPTRREGIFVMPTQRITIRSTYM